MVSPYHAADASSELIIYTLVIFSPWAFGTTQAWSIWVTNIAGFSLGALLFFKLGIRHLGGYRPPRWAGEADKSSSASLSSTLPAIARIGLLTLTIGFVCFCLTSAVNARSSYHPYQFSFDYFKHLSWLPYTYDRDSSWFAFWNYFALALSFWAIWDWLQGKSPNESRARRWSDQSNVAAEPALSTRLRRLLWLLAVNGALLGVEGVLQRLSGTDKLLWLVSTHINTGAESLFATYAYRSNAAQYFNLLWPVALGFWWTLQNAVRHQSRRDQRLARQTHHLLLPCIVIMAACPIISGSRAGALVTMACIILAGCILLFALRKAHGAAKFGLFLFLLAILGFGIYFGGDQLVRRMRQFDQGFEQREQTYAAARPMAKEHPLFGTGPGTFNVLFQFYRSSLDEYWPAQLHNDWLETLITFGWLGSGMIGLAFLLAVTRWFLPGGIPAEWPFVSMLWLALGGCLVHARFDFPLQICSILLLFLMICAILFSLTRRGQS